VLQLQMVDQVVVLEHKTVVQVQETLLQQIPLKVKMEELEVQVVPLPMLEEVLVVELLQQDHQMLEQEVMVHQMQFQAQT
jgi:hypothetical protein